MTSEKFARHGYLENTRPPTTIENLNTSEDNLPEKNVNVKRGKTCNLDMDGLKVRQLSENALSSTETLTYFEINIK